MSEEFDPYLQWLGIRDTQRPVNHYRLLGVELFENDPDVISNAADRQMAHVRTFQTGRRSAESQKILNELAQAKVCLLNPQKKTAYDTQLRTAVAAPAPLLSVPGAYETMVPALPPSLPSPTARRWSLAWTVASVFAATGVVLAALLVFLLGGKDPDVARDGDAVSGDAGQQTPLPQETAPGTSARAAPTAQGDAKSATDGKANPAKRPDAESPPRTPPEPPKKAEPPGKFEPKSPVEPGKTAKPPIETAKMEPKSPAAPMAPGIGLTSAPKETMQPKESPAEPPPTPPSRLPVPDASAQQTEKKNVREVFKARFVQARSPMEKGLLAADLLRDARETKDNPVASFVMLSEARDLAVYAGDASRLHEVVLEMAKAYEISPLEEETRALVEASETSLPSLVRASLARAAISLAQEALQADAYDSAARLAKAGFALASKVLASKGRDPQMIRQATELGELIPWYKQQHDLALQAEKALSQNPDHPKAMQFLGKYYALVKDQWDRGIPLLLKGEDPTLKALAEGEQAAARSLKPAEIVKLADQWMGATGSIEEPLQGFARRRALHWYEIVLPQLSGLTKERVSRVVETLKQGDAPRRK